MALAVCRGFGGTSRLWGGRCLALDAVDFTRRDDVLGSGWAIGLADLAGFYGRTSAFLGAGSGGFVDAGSDLPFAAEGPIRCNQLERWSNRPLISRQLAERLDACPRLTVVLDATVVDLEIEAGSDVVKGLVVASRAMRLNFRHARCFVLAMGGVETTRLLLNVQARFSNLFGGDDGALGRYYMGHLSGSIADIQFCNPRLAEIFDYRRGIDAFVRRRLTFEPTALEAEHLPNISFCPANPRLADAKHRSGVLSAAYLMLAAPMIGKRLVPEAILQRQISGPRRVGAHIRNMILDLPGAAVGLARLLRQVLCDRRSKPLLFLPSKAGNHPLHFHAEHRPNRDSRIRLSQERDALGLRRASIHMRFSDRDGTGVVRAHASLARALKEQGIADLIYRTAPEERASAVIANAFDGFHQIGSTRMAANPSDGVVDADCRVFEFRNLFIAGSSVFPTSGQANPTYSAVALALRLAAHLERQLKAPTVHRTRQALLQ